MTYRITKQALEARIKYLNELTGNPVDTHTKTDAGYIANIGNYHSSWAYGGCQLHRTVNEGGGVTCPLSTGYTSKRELFECINSFIAALEAVKYGHVEIA